MVAVRQTPSFDGKRAVLRVVVRAVQDKSAAGLDRAAHMDSHALEIVRHDNAFFILDDIQLLQQLAEIDMRRMLVDDDPHGAIGGMRAEIDHGTREARV